MKATMLSVIPGETLVLYAHEMVHEVAFGWPEEGHVVDFVDVVALLSGVASGGYKWWGV